MEIDGKGYPEGAQHPKVLLGFSQLDTCCRCGAEGATSWINVEYPDRHTSDWLLSLYLCRACMVKAIGRTYENGEIDWNELRGLQEGED